MTTYLAPTHANGAALARRGVSGPVVMLNLLRFRPVADYCATPDLAPNRPISGKEAFDLYIAHTRPHLLASGGELLFLGKGGPWFIGPEDAGWDCAMLVRQKSVEAFFHWAQDEAYLEGIGHRTAALADARLLPLEEAHV